MKTIKPQSVSVRNRNFQDLPAQVRLNEKIDKYTSLRLASILNNTETSNNTESNGSGYTQRNGIKSAGINFSKISPQEISIKLDERHIQDFKPVQPRSYNLSPDYFPNTSDQVPSQTGSVGHRHSLMENSLVTSTKNQTLNFSGFNFNNAIKDSRNDPKRKLIGTSGLTTGAIVQCDTKGKLAEQICKNLIGESPSKVKNGARNKFDQNLTLLNLSNLQFNRRSEKSKLFQDNLDKNQSSIISSLIQSQKQDEINTVKLRLQLPQTQDFPKAKKLQSPGQVSLVDSSNFRQSQDFNLDYLDSQRSRTTGVKSRPHTNQQFKFLQRQIANQVMDQFENQISRQTDKEWFHKPPTAQCAIQHREMKNGINRRQILQKLVYNQHQKTSTVSDISRTQTIFERKTSFNSKKTSYDPQSEYNITERKIENTAKSIDEKSMLNDPNKLRQYLRGEEAEEIYSCPTRHLFKSSAYQRQLKQAEDGTQEPRLTLKQRLQKALGQTLGQKELLRIQDLLQKQDGMKLIIDTLKEIRISATQAVEEICGDKKEQTRLLMFRQKYEQENEEKEHQQLVKMVEEHCENFYNQQNMNTEQLALFQKFSSSFQSKFQELVLADSVLRQTNNGSQLSNKSIEQSNSLLRRLSNKQRVQETKRQKMVKSVKSRIQKTSGINVHLNTDIFSQFIDKRETALSIQNQANGLIDKIFFNQMGKQFISRPNSQLETYEGDHRLYFLQKCSEQKEPVLDIINKIHDKQLILANYHLNPGQCEGLMHALMAEPELLRTLIIDNCGLTDDMTNFIVQGINNQKNMNHLYLKNTQIGVKSAQAISQLLQKQIPYNLDDLKLEKCEIKASAMSILLQLPLGISHLQKLTLVDLTFNEEHIDLLCRFIEKSKYLVKLDLSWNKFKLQNYLKLFKMICENRKLKDLSLAWNSLVEFNNLGVVGSFCENESELKERKTNKKHRPPELIKSKKAKKAAALLGEEENKDRIEFNTLEKVVVDGLQNFISQNTKLMHLDLSDTGLSEDMILEIVKAVNYSANLIALHLSGNPGLTIQVESKIFQILNATFEKSHKLNSFFTYLNQTESPTSGKANQKKLMEGVYLKNIKAQKQQFQPNDVIQLNNLQRRHLILTRKLGHKIDIPGGQQWQAFTNNSDECFVCDKKIYSVFLWTPEVGIIADEELNLTENQRNKISGYFLLNRETSLKRQDEVRKTGQFIKIKNKDEPKFDPKTKKYHDADDSERSESLNSRKSFDDELQGLTPICQTPALNNILSRLQNIKETQQQVFDKYQREIMIENKININGEEAPLLYGPFNNWQPQPMINVSMLAQYILDEPRPDFLQQMMEDGYCRKEVKTLNDLNRGERKYYDSQVSAFYERYEKFQVWSRALQSFIPYKSPHIYGIDYLQTVDAKQIYFSANFIGCGKQHFAVQYDNQIYLHKTIADFRKEEVLIPPLDAKEVNKTERNPNVFKNFVIDSHSVYEHCMRQDFEGWKLSRFVKDPGEQNDIRQVIRKEYSYLKDLFLTLSAHSNFPGLSMSDFEIFIESLEIIGGPLTIGIIETQFIAARTDAENRGMKIYGQLPQDINRFEFFEALVRVSGTKYKQQGLASNYAESLKKLIERIKEMFEFDTQQSFRDELLYTREVNLTLDANKEGLMEVYNKYINKKTQRVSYKRCMQLLTTDTNIKLSEKQATVCYAMSQMTCPDLVKNAFLCQSHMTFVEFLELVGRVAFMYLEDMDQPLEVKINFIMDEWLALVGYERLESVYFEEGMFEGDTNLQDSDNQLLRLRLSKKIAGLQLN